MWSSEHLPLCLFTEASYLWCPLCHWALLCFDQLPLCVTSLPLFFPRISLTVKQLPSCSSELFLTLRWIFLCKETEYNVASSVILVNIFPGRGISRMYAITFLCANWHSAILSFKIQFLLWNHTVLSLFFTAVKDILNAIVVVELLISSCLTSSKPHGCSSGSAHGISQAGRLVQFSSVAPLHLTLCDPMDCSMPGLTLHHQLLELAQTHVCWVGDAIQPSHPVVPFSSHFNLSQH